MDTKSELYKLVLEFGKPLLNIGFNIIESIDEGMGKYCILESNNFQIMIIYDKGPIHCDICNSIRNYCRSDKRYGDDKWMDVVHLSNYLNNKEKKYIHSNYYWVSGEKENGKYIQFYTKIIIENINLIRNYLNEINESSYQDFSKYYKNENLKNLKNKIEIK